MRDVWYDMNNDRVRREIRREKRIGERDRVRGSACLMFY